MFSFRLAGGIFTEATVTDTTCEDLRARVEALLQSQWFWAPILPWTLSPGTCEPTYVGALEIVVFSIKQLGKDNGKLPGNNLGFAHTWLRTLQGSRFGV